MFRVKLNRAESLDVAELSYCNRINFRLLVILAIHAGLLGYNAAHQSPTLNEPGHLVAGLSHWETGSFSLYRVNPPLVRIVGAVPVVIAGYKADWSGFYEYPGARPVFDMAERFIHANGRHSLSLFAMARLACIPFSLLGAYICFTWATDLFGRGAGYLSCGLWCFSPLVIGHASTIAPDAHAASLGLAACYTFWRWLKNPTWTRTIVTGGVLGLAELSKTTMVLLYPLWPILWIFYRLYWHSQMTWKRWFQEGGMLIVRMIVSIYILNLGYLCEGSLTKLKEYQFVSRMFGGDHAQSPNGGNRFRGTLLGEIYMPLPSNYITGIDIQQKDFEDFSLPSYLRGQYQAKGWWYYYAYAICVKTPVGTLGLIVLTLVIQFTRFRTRRATCADLVVLLAPPALIFAVASMKTGFSHHSRYILPCVPFVFIWVSQLARYIRYSLIAVRRKFTFPKKTNCLKWPIKRCLRNLIGIVSIVFFSSTVFGSLSLYPHSLSYFNNLAGGPRNGPEHLLNSNIDWGQDLLFLEQWIDENAEDSTVHLAFYNYYNPFDLEVKRIEPWTFKANIDQEHPHDYNGYYAISVNLLYDFPWPVRDREGHRYYIDTKPHAYLRSVEPIGRAGYSIRIFSAEQIRAAYDAKPSAPLWENQRDKR
jgi:4-amino-4-deoxy-L-arabinose transferase-like glycosyltransferase